MANVKELPRPVAVEIVLESLREVFAQVGTPVPEAMNDDTVLVGANAVLDSLGVVQLIVEVEQRVEQGHQISITLANDRAMSQKNSPFRTVGVLSDHLLSTIKETEA